MDDCLSRLGRTVIGALMVSCLATPAAHASGDPLGQDVNVFWTEISGSDAYYAGESVATSCPEPGEVRQMPNPNPIYRAPYVPPCYVDETAPGTRTSYFDRLNQSIASAEVLNRWMRDAAVEQCAKTPCR